MTTIINSPGGEGGGAGMIIGVVTVIAVVIVFVVYAVPAFRNDDSAKVEVPAMEVYKNSN